MPAPRSRHLEEPPATDRRAAAETSSGDEHPRPNTQRATTAVAARLAGSTLYPRHRHADGEVWEPMERPDRR